MYKTAEGKLKLYTIDEAQAGTKSPKRKRKLMVFSRSPSEESEFPAAPGR